MKIKFSAIILVSLVIFGSVSEVTGYEVWGCVCFPSSWPGCNCDEEEAADATGEKGCGLVFPIADLWGDDEYCEITNIPTGFSQAVYSTGGLMSDYDAERKDLFRVGICRGVCSNICTKVDACKECFWPDCWFGNSCKSTCDLTAQNCNPQGHKVVAKLGKCPSTAEYEARFPGFYPDGYECNIGLDPPLNPWPSNAQWYLGGKWDASEKKCISCDGPKEDKVFGDTSSIRMSGDQLAFVPTTEGGSGKCESACGADIACDEKAYSTDPSTAPSCKGGDSCGIGLGPGETCTGSEKCVRCLCVKPAVCGDGVWVPALEECDGGAGCPVGQTCNAACKCESALAACGNGDLDAGEQCDFKTPIKTDGIHCTGAAATWKCLSAGLQKCMCEQCGDNQVVGDEGCDPPGSVCGGTGTCNANCECVGGVVLPVPGDCNEATCGVYGIAHADTIDLGETKQVHCGNIYYRKKFNPCNNGAGAYFDITTPWDVTYNLVAMDKGDIKVYYSALWEYYVALMDVAADCSWVDVIAWCEEASSPEICDNGVDDDDDNGDGVNDASDDIDCEDNDCLAPGCGVCKTADCDFGAYGDYDYHCINSGGCSSSGDCESYEECDLDGSDPRSSGPCTCYVVDEMPPVCDNDKDDDGDGCFDVYEPGKDVGGVINIGPDSGCGGTENMYGDSYCLDAIDTDCDGLIDCNDGDCLGTAPDCNKCQVLECDPAGGVGTGGWSCPTAPFAVCSTNDECEDPTYWCNLETCDCEVPPPGLEIKWFIQDVGCRIIVLLQALVVGIAVLVLIYAGIKWMGSGVENPTVRNEAVDMVKAVFIGLAIIIIALQLLNMLFGAALGSIVCP